MKKQPEGPTDLYRYYDARGKLLYVGISLSALARFQSHKRRATWLDNVASMKIEKFKTRNEAVEAEAISIMSEKPLHNISHNRRPRAIGPHKKDGTIIPVGMKPETLLLLMQRENQTIDQFARRIGKGREVVSHWLSGKVPIPNYIALACATIHHNIEPLE